MSETLEQLAIMIDGSDVNEDTIVAFKNVVAGEVRRLLATAILQGENDNMDHLIVVSGASGAELRRIKEKLNEMRVQLRIREMSIMEPMKQF